MGSLDGSRELAAETEEACSFGFQFFPPFYVFTSLEVRTRRTTSLLSFSFFLNIGTISCEIWILYLGRDSFASSGFIYLLIFSFVQNALDLTAPASDIILKNRQNKWFQLSGHPDCFAPAGPGTIWKKRSGVDNSERAVYEALSADPLLRDLVPRYFREVEYQGEKFIELQDLLHGFSDPSVMDVKLGTRTFLESEVQKTTARHDLYVKVLILLFITENKRKTCLLNCVYSSTELTFTSRTARRGQFCKRCSVMFDLAQTLSAAVTKQGYVILTDGCRRSECSIQRRTPHSGGNEIKVHAVPRATVFYLQSRISRGSDETERISTRHKSEKSQIPKGSSSHVVSVFGRTRRCEAKVLDQAEWDQVQIGGISLFPKARGRHPQG